MKLPFVFNLLLILLLILPLFLSLFLSGCVGMGDSIMHGYANSP